MVSQDTERKQNPSRLVASVARFAIVLLFTIVGSLFGMVVFALWGDNPLDWNLQSYALIVFVGYLVTYKLQIELLNEITQLRPEPPIRSGESHEYHEAIRSCTGFRIALRKHLRIGIVILTCSGAPTMLGFMLGRLGIGPFDLPDWAGIVIGVPLLVGFAFLGWTVAKKLVPLE